MLVGLSNLKEGVSLFVAPLIQGVTIGLLCSFGVEIQKSFIGQVLLPTLLKESIKFTAGLLPALLAPYAFWIMVGIPALLMTYPFLSTLLNPSPALRTGEMNYAAYSFISWGLPLALFAGSMQLGFTFGSAWYMAAGLAAFTSAYWLTLCPLIALLRPPQATAASSSVNNATSIAPVGRAAPTFTPALQNTLRSNAPALENEERSVNIPVTLPSHRPS